MALPKPKLLLLQTLPMLTLLLLLLANMKLAHSQDTTSFTFDTFKSNPSDLIYQGDTHVPSGSSYLRLVKTDSSGVPQPASVGRVLYSSPVNFWESSRQATFETTIKFQIKPPSSGDAADGLAFFIAPVSTIIPNGSNGANLGIYGSSGTATSLFAVEFDIYVNGAWDPSYPHVGININSRTSSNVTRFEGALGQVVTARINYNSNTKTITTTTNYGSKTSTLSYVHDLKNTLTQQVRVGISASTGALVATFDVLSWYFTSTLVYTANNYDNVNGGAFIQKYA
ncbi:agglutinin-2-like [Henckelia pumila]|uniref:agglutinin-2-like n=1 Tax=Henckelia pumila TaxID=405737 RepID=UPI003C6E1791